MNPLGLLAGLGALNALSGGELGAMFGGKAATGKRFTGLLDMLDGGGAGASGGKFEGGGLLSMLGNLFMKPLEAQNKIEEIAARTSARDMLRPKLRPEGLLSEAQKEQIVMNQIVNPDVYGIGRGGEFAGSMLAPRATTAQSAAMEDAYSTTAPLSAPAPSYANMFMGEAGRGAPNMPRPVATTAALSPTGDMASGVAPVPPMSGQLSPMAPATPTTPYPSGMSPAAPSMPQGIMSFREFVDAERAAMSGADLYVDPANYRRGYARYLSSMGINPAAMGM